ncbi:FHA domain-containing protein [Plectonema radiosum NIES-515]|uniref:FHA domain-containing protein n=1 Tax=Plectonema radiosum NIES-515 TaxID=2986073 RepID=A0ABT3AYI6_9CYAN|nr:FHA domain-containing protein [Plectonema radiosum]MCV3214196.1 FHA domain-containing protein [Plectonema radiosum NIES-515]
MTNDISTYKCLKGHESTECDYCSECGVKILGAGEAMSDDKPLRVYAPKIPQNITLETCPACSVQREPNSGDFCEICGYNFVTLAHGEVPIVEGTGGQGDRGGLRDQGGQGGQRKISPLSSPSPLSSSPPITWELAIAIDPSLRHPESPEPPTNQQAIPSVSFANAFRLNKANNLIGRNSQARGIEPEIALDFDNAVSHRHALLNLQSDGSLTLRDINSSNGTKLNGVELKPMVDTLLQDGDEFTLGHWTRIVVKAVPEPL